MTDEDIRKATEAFERLLRRNRDCQFGRVDTTIVKGHVKEMTLHREDAGIRNGEVVALKLSRE